MTRERSLLLCAGLMVAAAVGACALRQHMQTPDLPKAASAAYRNAPAETLEQMAVRRLPAYKQWTRVNPRPAYEASWLDIACFISPDQQEAYEMETGNPHRHKYIVVYVNELAKKAMLQEIKPAFPIGSVVVKAKFTKQNRAKPELLTVMLKREAGYNPQHGDWEYFVTDGSGQRVQKQGILDKCQSCHELRSTRDYIFRGYLPEIDIKHMQATEQEKAQLRRECADTGMLLWKTSATTPKSVSSTSILRSLNTHMQSSLRAICPEAVVSATLDGLVGRYQTQIVMVHNIAMTGQISPQARAEQGPTDTGFLLHLSFITNADHNAPRQAVQPFGKFPRVYWTDYINEYPLQGSAGYLRLELSYGAHTDVKALNSILQVISASVHQPVQAVNWHSAHGEEAVQ